MTSRRSRRLCLLLVLLLVPLLRAGGAAASTSTTEEYRPGAHAAVRFVEPNGSQWEYIFARSASDNSLKYRKTDGLTSPDWSSVPGGGATNAYPAAAGPGNAISLFVRGMDNQLYVTKTTDGASYAAYPWKIISPGGTQLTGAPAALYFVGDNRIHAFYVSLGTIYTAYSNPGDGYTTFSAFASLGNPPGGLAAAAPVVSAVKASTGVWYLTLLVKASNGGLYQAQTSDGVNWGGWIFRSAASLGPSDSADYPLGMDVGINFIGGANWDSYQFPAFTNAKGTLAKFNMFYDSGASYVASSITTSQIQATINAGAKTIIFRTAESHTTVSEVNAQLGTLLATISANPSVNFWIEVGNEPDLHGLSAQQAHDNLLAVIQNVAPNYRSSYPNLRWMASMPTSKGTAANPGLSYLDVIMDDALIRSLYDAIGVHIYGDNTLFNSYAFNVANASLYSNPSACAGTNGDAKCPTAVLDRVLSKTRTPVYITEAGINDNNASWSTKAALYVQAMYRMPSQVRGFAIFTVDNSYAKWYAGNNTTLCNASVPVADRPCTNYALDVNTSGQTDYAFTGAKVTGNR